MHLGKHAAGCQFLADVAAPYCLCTMVPGFKLTLFVSDFPSTTPTCSTIQHAAFCKLQSCWLAFSFSVLLLKTLFGGLRQVSGFRNAASWHQQGSFHWCARLVEALFGRSTVSCCRFPLVGTALQSISPCNAATYHMCGQLMRGQCGCKGVDRGVDGREREEMAGDKGKWAFASGRKDGREWTEVGGAGAGGHEKARTNGKGGATSSNCKRHNILHFPSTV